MRSMRRLVGGVKRDILFLHTHIHIYIYTFTYIHIIYKLAWILDPLLIYE